jgi:superfamily I DNA and/or RNA helicase
VLVGDHHQLPPTIVSRAAELEGAGISLFERLSNAGVTTHLLDTQYRMHPAICVFPATYFYGGQLKSSEGLDSSSRPIPAGFHWPKQEWPIAFVSTNDDAVETSVGNSYANYVEARMVAEIVSGVLGSGWGKSSSHYISASIGVIAPYKAQVDALRQALLAVLTPQSMSAVEISSVDGFQGREKELIVFSATRANSGGRVGFVSDWRRLNVTLTRARSGLIVVGHAATLEQEPMCLRAWVQWARTAGVFIGKPDVAAPVFAPVPVQPPMFAASMYHHPAAPLTPALWQLPPQHLQMDPPPLPAALPFALENRKRSRDLYGSALY